MSNTLAAKQFSYDARTFRAYAGPNGELLHIEHMTKTVLSRPNRLAVHAIGDDGSLLEMLYDGKNLVICTLSRSISR